MNTALKTEFLSVDEYLAGEEQSDIRHEYLAGIVYAMAGGSEDHNTVGLNIAAALRNHLRGRGCRVFIFDMKARIPVTSPPTFYYPDVMVTCDQRDKDRHSKEFPKVVIEILSDRTERIDRGEKFSNYIQIPTLEEYVLLAQDCVEATIFARNKNWEPEILRFPEQKLHLRSLDFSIRLADLYEGTAGPL
jgi:Uma2 family endonuclease